MKPGVAKSSAIRKQTQHWDSVNKDLEDRSHPGNTGSNAATSSETRPGLTCPQKEKKGHPV